MRLNLSIPMMLSAAEPEFARAKNRTASQPIAVAHESQATTLHVAHWLGEDDFRAFYEETAPKLRGYIRKISGDASVANDILQEAFYKFLRAHLPSCERQQMRAYLYRIASSLVTDHWRRLQRERLWGLKNFMGSEPAADSHAGSETMQIFRRLKPRDQSLLWLAYVEGFEHREIAEILEMKEKSVRVLLFRARKKMATALGDRSMRQQG